MLLFVKKIELGTEKVAKLLIDSKADVNAKDLNGSTPLHWSASSGNFQIPNAISFVISL